MSSFAETVDATTIETLVDRGSDKWVTFPGAIGAWIAEMDFGLADPIRDALERLKADNLYGYASPAMLSRLREATAGYQQRRYGWAVDPDLVFPTSDVLHGLGLVLDCYLEPGKPIVLLTPCYMPFLTIPPAFGREIVQVPMLPDGDGWAMPWDALASALTHGSLLVLSSPYNPVGKVFTRAELSRLAEVVEAAGARVFADEIHAPLTFAGHDHVPYASVGEAAARHSITAVSASKAWNLAGLKCAQLILTNPDDVSGWRRQVGRRAVEASNPGIVAGIAAYTEGQPWLDDALAYLDVNRRLVVDELRGSVPGVDVKPLQGTYLQLIDLSGAGLPGNPRNFLLERARVALTDGELCAAPGCVRMNIATPTPILRVALERIATAIAER